MFPRHFCLRPLRALGLTAGLLALSLATGCGAKKAADASAGDAAAEIEAGSETAAAEPDASPAGPPGSGITAGSPYLVIRFPDGSPDYDEPLAEAVRRATARKPGLAFDLVAATPQVYSAAAMLENGKRAKQQADDVVKALAGLGIGQDRIHVVYWGGLPIETNEIRLYIR